MQMAKAVGRVSKKGLADLLLPRDFTFQRRSWTRVEGDIRMAVTAYHRPRSRPAVYVELGLGLVSGSGDPESFEAPELRFRWRPSSFGWMSEMEFSSTDPAPEEVDEIAGQIADAVDAAFLPLIDRIHSADAFYRWCLDHGGMRSLADACDVAVALHDAELLQRASAALLSGFHRGEFDSVGVLGRAILMIETLDQLRVAGLDVDDDDVDLAAHLVAQVMAGPPPHPGRIADLQTKLDLVRASSG